MSKKYYCDICGKETESERKDTLTEIEQLFEVAEIEECCAECLVVLKSKNIATQIRASVKSICCPKSLKGERESFMLWLASQSWVQQMEVYNILKERLKIQE